MTIPSAKTPSDSASVTVTAAGLTGPHDASFIDAVCRAKAVDDNFLSHVADLPVKLQNTVELASGGDAKAKSAIEKLFADYFCTTQPGNAYFAVVEQMKRVAVGRDAAQVCRPK